MIIDSHQHFWNYNPIRDKWINSSMKILQKDFLPQHLKPILDDNGIDGCIAVQADQSENENKFLLDCAENNLFIKGVVGWIDLKGKNIDNRLAFYKTNPLFKGVRNIVQNEHDNYLLRSDIQNGISKLSSYNLTYDLLIFPRQLPAAIALVEKFPKQIFILDHIAKPNISNSKAENWKKNITELSKFNNVNCKLSGMVTETEGFIFNDNDFYPYIDHIFKSFGPERILFGSDWPVCLLAANYKKVIEIVKNYLKSHSKKTKLNVMGLNAIKIYNL